MSIECDVIRDLLPLYAEDMLGEKSRELVKEHVAACEDCHNALAQMQNTEFKTVNQGDPIKKFGKAFRRHTITVATLSVLITVAVLVLIWGLVILEYFPFVPSIFVLLLLIAVTVVIGKRKNSGNTKPSKIVSQGDSVMKKKSLLILFVCSVAAFIISLKLFWNIAVYVDDFAVYPYASPQAVYGGVFWLYMAWVQPALLAVIMILSGIRLFGKRRS